MRVAVVGDYPLNGTRIWGGVEAAFAYLVGELAQTDGLELHVITLGQPNPAASVALGRIGATLHILPPFPRFEFARNFSTYQRILNQTLLNIQPDVVHAQGATDHAYAALRSGYPTVVTVHGVQSEDSKHQGTWSKRMRKWLYGRLIERYNLSHTRHLIAIGRYVVDYFAPLLHLDTQIYYIPNAIDESYFHLTGKTNGTTILYAGRVIRRKRTLDLVRAFGRVAAQLPSAELRIAGEFTSEPAYAELVRHEIRDGNLEARIRLLGGLSEEEIRYEFASCDVLALPSIQETTPMVIAQAMAAGKPVVATPVGGVAEMVADKKTGLLVPVGDTEKLAEALLSVLTDQQLATTLGQAAREFALENYFARSVAQKTRQVYSSIVQASQAHNLDFQINEA